MNTKILLLFLILVMGVKNNWGQTNQFTVGDNGTFEAPGSETDIINYNRNLPNTTITRSNARAYEGNYSLRVVTNHPSTGPRLSISFPYITSGDPTSGHPAGISLWVYIPSSENPHLSGPDISDLHLKVFSYSSCGDEGGRPNLITDQWVQFNPIIWLQIEMFTEFCCNEQLVYYIDKIEAKKSLPIILEGSINGNDIIVNAPTGGIQTFPGNDQFYPYPFYISWSDGITSLNRNDLLPGHYRITAQQWVGPRTGNCDPSAFADFKVPPFPPSITNSTPSRCLGEGADLVAASNDPRGGMPEDEFAWYDAAEGGTLLGTGPTLQIPPFQLPGVYNYYVQVNNYGTSSARTQTAITVHALPAGISASSQFAYPNKPKTFTAINHLDGDQYAFDFGDGNSLSVANSPITHSYATYGNFNVNVTTTSLYGCIKTETVTVEVRDYVPLCQSSVPSAGFGSFKLDQHSGLIIFDMGASCAQPYNASCIEGKIVAQTINNVVGASATTYSDNWKYFQLGYAQVVTVPYEQGDKGKWRPAKSFSYNTSIDFLSKGKNYEAGKYSLSNFSWQNPAANTRTGWLLVNEVERYSRNGDPIQERNALNVTSTAKFGYGKSVPYLVAQNATYESVMFEGFEVMANNVLRPEEGIMSGSVSTDAHSGKNSFAFTQIMSGVIDTRGKALQVRFWAKGISSSGNINMILGTGSVTPIKKIAQSGEWILWESIATPNSNSLTRLQINKWGGGVILIDDLRIQPIDAEMTCYVYDPRTLRLLAVFDDQHFGLYYQYNDEGKLVRKMVETERGVKTIQETQYNLPTKPKAGE